MCARIMFSSLVLGPSQLISWFTKGFKMLYTFYPLPQPETETAVLGTSQLCQFVFDVHLCLHLASTYCIKHIISEAKANTGSLACWCMPVIPALRKLK
jgi:hypothetical protein